MFLGETGMAAARGRQAKAQRNAPTYAGAPGSPAEPANALRGHRTDLGTAWTASSASGVLPIGQGRRGAHPAALSMP
jgi:hypothetical protein